MHRERWSEKEGCEGETRSVDDEEPEERRLRGKRERERKKKELDRRTYALHESSGLDP